MGFVEEPESRERGNYIYFRIVHFPSIRDRNGEWMELIKSTGDFRIYEARQQEQRRSQVEGQNFLYFSFSL